MKRFFKPFTGEGFLIALGLTLASYLIVPLIKEVYRSSIQNKEKGIYSLEKEKEEAFLMNKGELS